MTEARAALQKQWLPIQMLWEAMVDAYGAEGCDFYVLLDKSPMLEIIRTGRKITMRHLPKTQGISVGWLHEVCSKTNVHIRYITISFMAADTFTKSFTDKVSMVTFAFSTNGI